MYSYRVRYKCIFMYKSSSFSIPRTSYIYKTWSIAFDAILDDGFRVSSYSSRLGSILESGTWAIRGKNKTNVRMSENITKITAKNV